ncbi:acyl-CoA dehydrogenase family protein [Teichococcus oryzae]|nr:acyl-CoA dehydrogenase family protein [Pseudoroseomonas oryzae]
MLASAQRVASFARLRAQKLDRDGAFPEDEITALAEEGLLAAPLPPKLGGGGLGQDAGSAALLAQVLMQIGAGSLPLGRIYEGHVNALGLVLAYGGPEQQRRAAADALAGRLFGVWNTDDRQRPLCMEGGVLRGRKILASGAGWVGRALVTAATPDGPLMLLLPLSRGERADLSGWTAQGMRASATGAVDFEGMRVPSSALIGEAGDYQRQPVFSGGAWRFLAVQTGGAAELLSLMCRHLRELGRDSDPHQRVRAGESAAALETATLWVERAARHMAQDALPPEAKVAYVNLARGVVERAALEILTHAQRSVGLMGFMRPHPMERVARDLATYLRQPAPDLALQMGGAFVLEQEGGPW